MTVASVLAVIPARYQSTRLPGKPLMDMEGLPMIVRVLQQVELCEEVDRAIVATDDARILSAVRVHGGEAVMTSPDHCSGSDRIVEAIQDQQGDLIVNVQGDEPLIEPSAISAVIRCLQEGAEVASAAAPLTGDPHQSSVVKVVMDEQGRALYFSRAPIPKSGPWWQHLGLYGFRRERLLDFHGWEPGPLERSESLEQLRFLEHGVSIQIVTLPGVAPSVDTWDELEQVRSLIRQRLGAEAR